MTATGGVAPYNVTDPATGEVQAGHLEGAGAEHRLLPLRRGGGPLHPRLRPPVLADVGVGRRRRRPDERPADRHADRLPQEHPDRPRGLRATARTTRDLRVRSPARRHPGTRSRPPPARRSRTATPPAYGEALFNLGSASGAYSCARCHTPGLELRRARRVRPGCVRLEPHRRRANAHFPNEADMIAFIKTGSTRAPSTAAGPGQRPHAGLRQHAHRRADRGHRRVRAEPVMSMTSARHRLGARAPRHPHRHHGRRRAVRHRLPRAGDQPRRPARLPRRARRARRLDVADGWHLVDLRHRPQGRRRRVEGGAREDGHPERRAAARVGRARRAARPQRRRRRRPPRPTSLAEQLDPRAGTASTSPPPSSVRPRPRPACSSRRRTSSRPASSTSPTCSRSAASAYPKPSATSSTSSPSGTSRTTRWSRSPRSCRCAPSPAGRRRSPRSTRRSSASTCTWSATSARCASRRRSSASARRSCSSACAGCSTGVTGSSPRNLSRKALGRRLIDGPVPPDRAPAGARHRVRRAQLRRLAAARAAPPVRRQGGAVRVRHRAQPRATRALPGQLLRGGDVVHHVRHRDRVPLPVRGRARDARRLRVLGDRRLLRDLLPDLRVRGRARRARLGPAPRVPPPRPDAAMVSPERDSSSTIRRVGLEGRTDLVTAEGAASTPDDGVAA